MYEIENLGKFLLYDLIRFEAEVRLIERLRIWNSISVQINNNALLVHKQITGVISVSLYCRLRISVSIFSEYNQCFLKSASIRIFFSTECKFGHKWTCSDSPLTSSFLQKTLSLLFFSLFSNFLTDCCSLALISFLS